MVEATVELRNGEKMLFYANNFDELFADLAEYEMDVIRLVGRTIKTQDMRQGREKRNV